MKCSPDDESWLLAAIVQQHSTLHVIVCVVLHTVPFSSVQSFDDPAGLLAGWASAGLLAC